MRKLSVKVLTLGTVVALASLVVANLIYIKQKPPSEMLINIQLPLSMPSDSFIPPEWTSQNGDTYLNSQLLHFSAQYDWPRTLPYGRSSEMIFIIEGDRLGSGDDLIKRFPGDPEKIEIRGNDQMSVTLTGPKGDVEVTPRNPELQAVTHLGLTKWIWDIEPKRTGTVFLLSTCTHICDPSAKAKPLPRTS
jgi:hypothetical protein